MCMYTVLYVDIRSYVLTIIPVSACRKQLNAGLVSWQLHSHSARLIGLGSTNCQPREECA